MAQRYPIAYMRRSSADATNPGDVSREAQEAAVRELARRDGYNGELRILSDWDRSADDAKEGRRTGFTAMLAAIERGEVSAVYAASLDRLYRSLRTFVRLTDAARERGVRIVTLREGVLGGDGSPMAVAFAEITAVFSALELRTTKARAGAALAVRRQRGDHVGRVGYGYLLARNNKGAIVAVADPNRPLEPILGAVREAGSILGAAKLLQAHRIPAPDGGAIWASTTLRRILEHAAPDLIPPAGPTGRRTPTHSMLAQLLVCHCGRVLTPEPARRAYRCTRGNRTGGAVHGKVWVSEAALMPFVKSEAARLRIPFDAVQLARRSEGKRIALERQREAIITNFEDGLRTREERDARLTVVAAKLAALDDAETVIELPALDWNADVADINGVLRALWRSIQLDEQMRPIEATWLVPEWRAAS